MRNTLLTAFFLLASLGSYAQSPEIIKLWKHDMPNKKLDKGKLVSQIDSSKNLLKITEVSDPLIEIYSPKVKSNQATVIISPGGGQKFLAWNLEGTEIADWLTGLGYTAVVLQYRVPNNQTGALKDLQRAIKLVRSKADKLNIADDKIGVMGFSAGGNMSARAVTGFKLKTDEANDDLDTLSAKPNFALLIYPGSMSTGEDRHLIPEIPVDGDTPPVFIFATADDPYNAPFSMAVQLRKFKIPFEFHIMPKGGHGYGLRKGNAAAEAWPNLAENWLKNLLKFN